MAAENHLAAGIQGADVDDMGMAQLALDFLDAAFDKTLLLAGGMVFGIFLQIAMRARLGDGLNDARAIDGLQSHAAPRAIFPRRVAVIGTLVMRYAPDAASCRLFTVAVVQIFQRQAGRLARRPSSWCRSPCAARRPRRIAKESAIACLPSVVLTIRVDLVVLDHVDDMRPPFQHLVDDVRRSMPAACRTDGGAAGGDDPKPRPEQIARQHHQRPACRHRAR